MERILRGKYLVRKSKLSNGKTVLTLSGVFHGYSVKVAVLNNNINSITYPVGKLQHSTIIIDKQNKKLIEVKEILLENDSMIVCRK